MSAKGILSRMPRRPASRPTSPAELELPGWLAPKAEQGRRRAELGLPRGVGFEEMRAAVEGVLRSAEVLGAEVLGRQLMVGDPRELPSALAVLSLVVSLEAELGDLVEAWSLAREAR